MAFFYHSMHATHPPISST